eukprot:521507_1
MGQGESELISDKHTSTETNDCKSIYNCDEELFECENFKQISPILKGWNHYNVDNDKYEKDIYDILNNFHHLICFHDNDTEFELIHKQTMKCNINKCMIFRRNYRDRLETRNDIEKRKMHYNTNDNNAKSIYQILDKIHCYYHHSYDIGYRTNIKREQKHNLNEEKLQQTQYYYQQMRIITKFDQLSADPVYVAGAFSFGAKFQYNKREPIHDPTRVESTLVTGKYIHLQYELTNNAICRINIEQYYNEFNKATIHHRSWYNKCMNHSKLNKEQLLALLIYTNYDVLQSKFSETYWNNIEKHTEFYHLGKVLQSVTEVTMFPPRNLDTNHDEFQEKLKLYHGISKKLCFPAYNQCHIWTPLSTTTSFSVAANFTNHNKGLVVELSIKNYQQEYYLSLTWLSDYPSEKEHLFIQSGRWLQMTNIIDVTTQEEYESILKATFIISRLLSPQKINEDVDQTTQVLVINIIYHYLAQKLPHKYASDKYEFKTLNEYARQIINTFFELKRECVEIDCSYWLNKHKYMAEILFHEDRRWIKMEELNALFPNISLMVDTTGMNLNASILEDILQNYSNMNFKRITFNDPVPTNDCLEDLFNAYKEKFQAKNVELKSLPTTKEWSLFSVDWRSS